MVKTQRILLRGTKKTKNHRLSNIYIYMNIYIYIWIFIYIYIWYIYIYMKYSICNKCDIYIYIYIYKYIDVRYDLFGITLWCFFTTLKPVRPQITYLAMLFFMGSYPSPLYFIVYPLYCHHYIAIESVFRISRNGWVLIIHSPEKTEIRHWGHDLP